MAIVSTCTYDPQGRLIRPGRHDIGRAKFSFDLDTGESLTLDRGHVHVHTVTSSGLTAEQACQRAKSKLARFFDRVEDVTGYRKIAMSKTQGVIPCNRNVTITYEILYAVEPPRWARRHSPGSPNAGSHRDRSVVTSR